MLYIAVFYAGTVLTGRWSRIEQSTINQAKNGGKIFNDIGKRILIGQVRHHLKTMYTVQ
jgi:hypothetical protein